MNSGNGPVRAAGIAVDAGFGAVSVAVLAGTAHAIANSWGGRYWPFDCVAGLVVCVIALARRRHRCAAATVGLGVAAAAIVIARLTGLPHEPGPAMVLALSVLVGSAIRGLPVRPAVAVAAAGLAVVTGAWAAGGFTAVAVMSETGWLAAVAVGLLMRHLDARDRATTERVRHDERLELARELHDAVAHHITGIVVQAQAARIVARRDPADLDGSLAGIEAAGSDALSAMRRVVGLLRDADDGPPATPGPEQLSELVRRFGGRGPAVRLRSPDGESGWPPEVTSTVYRVVQEALTNVSRHAAHAGSVTVTVAQDRSAITVEVVDDASPAPVRYPHRTGYGLVGMRERVQILGGTLRAGPRPDAGWSVLATLPVPAQDRR
jgi:signal transduction histidine kinase